jgi:hypothetical protein
VVLANFSKLKNLQSSNFSDFRKLYRAKLEKFFLVPADTFDNVRGQFPIGFFIWNSEIKDYFSEGIGQVFNKNGDFIGEKTVSGYDNQKGGLIGRWLITFKDNHNMPIGMMNSGRNDFQNQNIVQIANEITDRAHALTLTLTLTNLIPASVFFAVRKVIPADWLNDRDQFLYPNDGWQTDEEFQNDCLAYTLFSNNIQSKFGINHWIPFTENEINARDKFTSNFMTDFIKGKKPPKSPEGGLFAAETPPLRGGREGLQFSQEAQNVFTAGRELWKYYHTHNGFNNGACPIAYNVNASLYDIREHFQGRNDKGKMNNKSTDEKYNLLIGNLRSALKILAKKIEPEVYEYGFLRG